MSYKWENKVVIITGAATGIGEKCVRLLLKENVKHVAVLDVAEDQGLSLQNELNSKYELGKVKFYKCDVTNDAQLIGVFEAVKKQEGYIDVLINNAGIMNDSPASYKKEIEINVTALVTGTLKAQEFMRKDLGGRGGTIVNISSVAGLTKVPEMPIYWATKSAVIQFSNCIGISETYAKTGVRVFSICYGATQSTLVTREKCASYDKTKDVDDFLNALLAFPLQSMESAAYGMIEAFKKAESGSVWIVHKNSPAVDVTDKYNEFYKTMHDIVLG